MSTLAEIEEAAELLPLQQKEELIHFLSERLHRARSAHTGRTTDLAKFSGVVRLPDDPLAWQQQCRSEWK